MVLSEDQRLELSRIAQSRSLPAGYVFRGRLILMVAEGASYNSVKLRLGTTAPTISRWKQRFLAAGLDGLDTAHPGQKPSVLTAMLRARSRQDGSSAMVSNTIVTERCRCTLRWKRLLVACTAKPQLATPARTSLSFSKRSSLNAQPRSRFTSSSTTSRPTRPGWSTSSFKNTAAFTSTSPRPTLRGSIRLSCGSVRSSET